MGWFAIAAEFARSFWASVPGCVQWLLVVWLILRASEPVARMAVERKRALRGGASAVKASPRKGKPSILPPAAVEAGLAEVGNQARAVRWDGRHYTLDGVMGDLTPHLLADLFARHSGRLHTVPDPARPGVMMSLPAGAEAILAPCDECGKPMVPLPSASAPGTWRARCEDGHDRDLSIGEEGLLARLTGLKVRAGTVSAPDGDHDVLWDGRCYRVAGVPGTLPPDGIGSLASRPQVTLFGAHGAREGGH